MVYLDNSATTFPKPEGVLEAATELYLKYGVNVGRGKGHLEKTAKEIVENTSTQTTLF